MASLEKFGAILAKAEECAEIATREGDKGIAVREMHASLARMYLAAALVEHQVFTAETLTRRVEGLARRVDAIERGEERRMPDPFDEPIDEELVARVAAMEADDEDEPVSAAGV